MKGGKNNMIVDNRDYYEKIYEKYCSMVYRICFMYLKNEYEAYDATHETFLKMMKKNTSFIDEEHEKAWLIVTASNCSKDMLRSFWRRHRANLECVPEEGYEQKEFDNNETILKAVLNLPNKYKDLVYLHYYEEYSIEEIAAMLHKNSSTMRSRLSKAKKILKEVLKEEQYE